MLLGEVNDLEMIKDYLDCEKLEKIPEQGDWKVADDLLIVLDEYYEHIDE